MTVTFMHDGTYIYIVLQRVCFTVNNTIYFLITILYECG